MRLGRGHHGRRLMRILRAGGHIFGPPLDREVQPVAELPSEDQGEGYQQLAPRLEFPTTPAERS